MELSCIRLHAAGLRSAAIVTPAAVGVEVRLARVQRSHVTPLQQGADRFLMSQLLEITNGVYTQQTQGKNILWNIIGQRLHKHS